MNMNMNMWLALGLCDQIQVTERLTRVCRYCADIRDDWPTEQSCPPRCSKNCTHGFVKDSNGCDTCECEQADEVTCNVGLRYVCQQFCKSDFVELPEYCYACGCDKSPRPATIECPQSCDMECEHGFEKDENGCDMCQCAEPECSKTKCFKYCRFGFKKDRYGCHICECKTNENMIGTLVWLSRSNCHSFIIILCRCELSIMEVSK